MHGKWQLVLKKDTSLSVAVIFFKSYQKGYLGNRSDKQHGTCPQPWTIERFSIECRKLLANCFGFATSLSDWFNVLAPFFQPIRSETQTNRGLRVHIFPRFVSATCNYFEFWFTGLSSSF